MAYPSHSGPTAWSSTSATTVAKTFASPAIAWEKARNVRQGFMDPKQKAAFEEFLARQDQ
ncbi:hypothetical protein ABZ208_33155 [Streptomyces sp. NPDC006208]|uniref:hypothetical protein n=1 Tax=Streptomyces sp. NPDC006208 TaxID=3156734 RepID=UPI0033A5ABB9